MWYKDGREIKADEHLSFTEGVLKLEIAQVMECGVEPMCEIACIPVYFCVV